MGIRVHKELGYGLTDVMTNEAGDIIDPRFTGSFHTEGFDDLTLQDYLDFLKKCQDDGDARAAWAKPYEKPKNWRPYKSFTHEAEFGLANVFLVTPVEEVEKWKRYDDMLDWVEEARMDKHHDGSPNWVKEIHYPLYPYDTWMDSATGEGIRDAHSDKQVVRFLLKDNQSQLTTFLNARGFPSLEEYEKRVVPNVPDSIRYLCRWADIFVDPKTVLELRPLLYVYWG